MKIKKSLLILVILFGCFSNVNAQIVDRVKVLFFSFNTTKEFPIVYSDSVMVSKISNDTTWFNNTANHPVGQGFYYQAGQKVYKKEAVKDILLYDYGLTAGDSFFIGQPYKDTFIVDSVYKKKLNHRTFKAWHLSNKHYYGGRMYWEWIEGLGELRVGWNTKQYIFTDGGWEIKGICLNDSVIYWNTEYNYFKDRNPSPTCMFDSVSKKLSIQNSINKDVFNLYPNPASDFITVNSEINGVASIVDYTGKVCMREIPLLEGIHTIDISTLRAGVYLMAIQFVNEVVYKRICVIKN